MLRRFDVAVDLGSPGEAVRNALAGLDLVGAVIKADAALALAPAVSPALAPGLAPLAVAADEELLPFRDAALDLVVSALALQDVNDLPGTLAQIRRVLKPDGLFSQR